MAGRWRRPKLGRKSVAQKTTNSVKYTDELDKIHAEIVKRTDVTILNKLLPFGSKLLKLIYRDTADFINQIYESEEIMEVKFYPMLNIMDGPSAEMYVRAVMQTIKIGCDKLRPAIDKKTANDYPKFLGVRSNFWRYLLHLTHDILKIGKYDFTTCFITVSVCLIELICCCQNYGQVFSFEQCRRLWVFTILHFFGDRFKNQDPSLVLHLASNQLVALNKVMNLITRRDTEPDGDRDGKKLSAEELRRRLQLAKNKRRRKF